MALRFYTRSNILNGGNTMKNTLLDNVLTVVGWAGADAVQNLLLLLLLLLLFLFLLPCRAAAVSKMQFVLHILNAA